MVFESAMTNYMEVIRKEREKRRKEEGAGGIYYYVPVQIDPFNSVPFFLLQKKRKKSRWRKQIFP